MYWRSLGTSTREPTRRSLEARRGCSSSRSWKASAMATSLVPESAVRACSAAPVPRPPQPTRPTLIVLLPAAWTRERSSRSRPPSRSLPRRGGRALQEIAPARQSGGRGGSVGGALRLRSVSHGGSPVEWNRQIRSPWACKSRSETTLKLRLYGNPLCGPVCHASFDRDGSKQAQ